MAISNKVKIYSILLLAILVASTSAIFIRWADDVSSPVLAFYRLLISGFILLTVSQLIIKKKSPKKLEWHWHYILAGVFLAFHFITWIGALKLTTIANAIFLGTTHPFFAVILSILFLKEIPKGAVIPIFILCLIGIYLMVKSDLGLSVDQLTGDMYAVLSAIFFASYLLIVRLHREKIQIVAYLGSVYTIAALVCLIFILIRGDALTGFSDRSWIMIVLLALGPSLTGHSLLNWVSKYLEIYKVNLAMLLEPVLATLAGMFIFMEYPGINFYIGATLIIVAMMYLIYQENKVRIH